MSCTQSRLPVPKAEKHLRTYTPFECRYCVLCFIVEWWAGSHLPHSPGRILSSSNTSWQNPVWLFYISVSAGSSWLSCHSVSPRSDVDGWFELTLLHPESAEQLNLLGSSLRLFSHHSDYPLLQSLISMFSSKVSVPNGGYLPRLWKASVSTVVGSKGNRGFECFMFGFLFHLNSAAFSSCLYRNRSSYCLTHDSLTTYLKCSTDTNKYPAYVCVCLHICSLVSALGSIGTK